MSPLAVALAGLAALASGMGIGRFAFTPILPMMQADGALTLEAGGWLAAANYAGYLAGALTAAFLSSATAIRAGLFGVALFTLLMGFVDSLLVWTLLRGFAGVASAWLLVHVSAWCLERLAPLGRPALNGTVYAGVGAGSVVAGLVCLVLLQFEVEARHAWIALGLFALVFGVLLAPVFTAHKAERRSDRSRLDAHAWRLIACYGAFGFGYIIPATFIAAFARETLADPLRYGWAWPMFGLAAAASTLAVAPLVRRLGDRGVWIAGHVVMAAGVAAPLAFAGMAGIALSALAVGATFMVVTMTGLQAGRALGGAALLAPMTAAFAAGQIAGPAFVSLVLAAGGRLEHALASASLLLLLSAFALLIGGRPRDRSHATAQS